MNADAQLLNYIFQNTQIGINSLSRLIDMNDNDEFKSILSEHVQDYIKINDAARDLLLLNGYEEKEINSFKEIASYLMVNIMTLTDKSSSKMAKMIIQGSNKGILEINEMINHYDEEADKDIIKLMKNLGKLEESNIEELKKFI